MKKSIVVFLILFCSVMPAFGQQASKADIQSLDAKLTKLQEIVTGMDKRLTAMDERLTVLEVKVTGMDKRLTTQITEMDRRLTNQIAEMDKRLSNQIASLYTFVRWAIGTLILVVLAVIALPQIFGYLRDKKEREELQKRVEQLEQEVTQLKARIFTS